MAITGYRWYRIKRDDNGHPYLASITKKGQGASHIIEPARCVGSGLLGREPIVPDHFECLVYGRESVPARYHHCGYYGYWTMANALLNEHASFSAAGEMALLEILAWGKVQHHQLGFRAERIMLKSVFVSGDLDEEIADVYRANKRPWSDAIAMLTELESRRVEWVFQAHDTERLW